jgi:hypothetical protein
MALAMISADFSVVFIFFPAPLIFLFSAFGPAARPRMRNLMRHVAS